MDHPSRICVRILTGLVVSSPLYGTQYSIDILPPPLIHPVGINAKGEVAGDGGVYDDRVRAFTRLQCTGPNCSVKLTSINDYSLVAGAIRYDDPNSLGGVALKPAYWQPKLSLAPNVLGTEPDTATFIAGISDTNDFAGQLDSPQMSEAIDYYIVSLNPQGWGEEFFLFAFGFCGAPAHHPWSVATGVNDAHHVTGTADWSQMELSGGCMPGRHPFIAIDGRLTDVLNVPNGLAVYYARANSINNSDAVVGDAFAPGDLLGQNNYTAALYATNSVTYLGTLQNQQYQNSSALAINDYNEIVGWSDVWVPGNPYPVRVQRAFVSTGVGMSDLTSLITPRSPLAGKVVLTHANAINCNGWIVADGYDAATNTAHAYVLKPQPQPIRADCLKKRAYPDEAPTFPIPTG